MIARFLCKVTILGLKTPFDFVTAGGHLNPKWPTGGPSGGDGVGQCRMEGS